MRGEKRLMYDWALPKFEKFGSDYDISQTSWVNPHHPQYKLDIPPNVDFYHLLGITYDAPLSTIKAAYHKALLASHPDKRSSSSTPPVHVDIALLKEAYTTLSNVSSRIAYDNIIRNTRAMAHTGPRPAQVISLEDFEEVEEGEWKHPCRCGGAYNVAEEDMDAGRHLVGCESCSEVVWVGYELVNDEGDEGK
jgi:diphthamide biosynthesis protein 4